MLGLLAVFAMPVLLSAQTDSEIDRSFARPLGYTEVEWTYLTLGYTEVEWTLKQADNEVNPNAFFMDQARRNAADGYTEVEWTLKQADNEVNPNAFFAAQRNTNDGLVKTHCREWACFTLLQQGITKNEADQLIAVVMIQHRDIGLKLADMLRGDDDQTAGEPFPYQKVEWTYLSLLQQGYTEKEARALIAVVIITLTDGR
jgi:hypothetical protein